MHWGPIDMPTIIKRNVKPDINFWKNEWKPIIDKLNERKDNWKKAVEDAPIMHDFLKKEFYE